MNIRDAAKSALTGVVALSTLLAVDAHAERPQQTRERGLERVDVDDTDATEGLTERAARREPEEEPEPALSADEFMQVQTETRAIRDEQIENYRMLIENTRDADPDKPDLLFRLADLYSRKQRYHQFQGMDLHPQIDRAEGREEQQLRRRQQQYFEQSREALIGAIQTYAQIARNPQFREYERMPEVLFYYAFTLQEADYMDQAREVYRQLIQQHPDSQYVPFAFLAFGDHFFEEEELDRAEQFYSRVLEFPDSPVYAYAMYKMGWVQLNLDRFQDALETFYRVAEITEGDDTQETLNQNAKNDFVRAYSEVGEARRAHDAFRRVDRGYAFTMLELLGDLYVEQGKAREAVFTFRELMRLDHTNKKVCEWQHNVVRAMLSGGTPRQQVDEIKRLVGLYKRYEGENVLTGHYEEDCRRNAMSSANQLGRVWHNEALSTLNMSTLDYVEELYDVYIRAFPRAEDRAEIEYYYAEIMWSRAEHEDDEEQATELWEDAAIAFTQVVESGDVSDELIRESAYASVLGWQNALAVQPEPEDIPTEDEDPERYEEIPEPQPIDDRNQQMLRAFDIYIDYVDNPDESDLADMKFYQARIYWEHDHLEEANELFADILRNHRGHEVSRFSANLLLDSLNRLQRYEEMHDWVERMLSWDAWLADQDELYATLNRLKSQALRRTAESYEDRGDYVACGEKYREIYNRDPQADDADELLFNSGACYEEGKSIGLAIRMFETLSQQFPDAELTQRAIVRLGNNYGAIAHYDQAAERYETYAREYGGEEDAPEALSNAVFYRRGIGDDQQAIENTRFFIRQYGSDRPDEAADAMFSIAAIYEKRGEMDALVNHLEEYLSDFRRQGGPDRALIAHARIGQVLWDQSCPVDGEEGACVRVERERSLAHGQQSGSRQQCGPDSAIDVTVVDRDPRLVREARQHFNRAVRAWNDGRVIEQIDAEDEGALQARQSRAAYWYAASRFYMNEQDYEEYLSVDFPSGLDFDPRNEQRAQRSQERFQQWLQRKGNLSESTTEAYQELVEFERAPQWSIAAAARIGQVSQNFSDALFTAEIPRDVREGEHSAEATRAYCDTLTTEAQPLEDLSVDAFGYCLQQSTQLNWFNEWSELCERELGQIRPQDFPTASELHAAPEGVASITHVQDAVLELD